MSNSGVQIEQALIDAIETYCVDEETTEQAKTYFGNTTINDMIEESQGD